MGIPKTVTPEEIKLKIKEDYAEDVFENLHKEISREKAKSYQLILDLDDAMALRLLKEGRILVGFLSCKIRPYASIVRCNNCQYYQGSQMVRELNIRIFLEKFSF